MTYEGFRLKINKWRRRFFSDKRGKRINNRDFTIISNNCWGGMIYESYNMQKLSPTIGLFFMASDYIKFVTNLKSYISEELHFIKLQESHNYGFIKQNTRNSEFPIARLGDIEIMFLHAHSEEEARSKWQRRCSRINWDKLCQQSRNFPLF